MDITESRTYYSPMALLDLLRPQWKHSDPEKRLAVARGVEDDRTDVLLQLATEDSDPGVRLAAAKRLRSEADLRAALASSTDKAVQEVLRRTLSKIVAEWARTAPDVPAEKARAWIDELRNLSAAEKALEDLALHAVSATVRGAASAGLTHASTLLTIATKEREAFIALDALQRLSRPAHLEAVAKNAVTRETRRVAGERLQALAAAGKPSEETLNHAKLRILATTVERVATESGSPDADFDWEGACDTIDEAERTLQELLAANPHGADGFRGILGEHFSAFRRRHALHAAAEEERRKREEEERRLLETQAALCERMEEIHADPRPADPDEVTELSRRFEEAGHGPEGNPMRERFHLARERVLKEKLRKQQSEEEAEQRRRNAETAQDRLKVLTREAAALNDSAGGPADADALAARVWSLQRDWDAAASRSDGRMHNALLLERFGRSMDGLREKLAAARRGAAESLEAAVTELGALAASSDLRAAEKRFKELRTHAKTWLAGLDDDAKHLIARWHTAADHLRDTLEWNRWANLKRKEEVCGQLETLLKAQEDAANPDLRPVFSRFKELTAEWKSIGSVPWDANDALWERYNAASDALYEKCREFFAELESEREANLKAKEDLCSRLEELIADEAADWREVNEAFREAHATWKDMGAVPSEQSDALWMRFRTVNKVYHDRRDGILRENLRAKQELADLAENLKDSTEWKKTAARIKEAQVQWKAIGPVPRDKSGAIWERFHGACETFFKARKAHYDQLDAERPRNLEKKLALCTLVETLDELDTDEGKHQRILDAQAQWKAIGPVPRDEEDALWERFRKPIDAYFDARRERGAADREAREEGIRIKEDICTEAESLPCTEAESLPRDGDRREVVDKIRALQAKWKAAPAAPRAVERELWQRFRAACDAFFGQQG